VHVTNYIRKMGRMKRAHETGGGRERPGVSMMVRLGQNLYSIFTTISRCQNCWSLSRRAFSFSMYSCTQSADSIFYFD